MNNYDSNSTTLRNSSIFSFLIIVLLSSSVLYSNISEASEEYWVLPTPTVYRVNYAGGASFYGYSLEEAFNNWQESSEDTSTCHRHYDTTAHEEWGQGCSGIIEPSCDPYTCGRGNFLTNYSYNAIDTWNNPAIPGPESSPLYSGSEVWRPYWYTSPPTCNNPLYPTGEDIDADGKIDRCHPYTIATVIPKIQSCPASTTPTAGNPCNISTGDKIQTESDYVANGNSSLPFTRLYNSQNAIHKLNHFGKKWSHSYSRFLSEHEEFDTAIYTQDHISAAYSTPAHTCVSGWNDIKDTAYNGSLNATSKSYSNGTCSVILGGVVVAEVKIVPDYSLRDASERPRVAVLTRDNGNEITFNKNSIAGTWSNADKPLISLYFQNDIWTYTNAKGKVETYDIDGKLLTIVSAEGRTTTLTYDVASNLGGDDNASTLDKVVDSYGNVLTFGHDANTNLNRVTTPDGDIVYEFTADNLTKVTYADGNSKTYVYENTTFPNHLTGIIDENGDRYNTWGYDANGRSNLSEHTNSTNRVTLTYSQTNYVDTTEALGGTRRYYFDIVNGAKKLSSVEGDRCTYCNHDDVKSKTYNAQGQVTTRTDWNDVVTSYTYNTNGQRIQITEAVGTPEERITLTSYNSQNLPSSITESDKQTLLIYDSLNRLLSITVIDLNTQENRHTVFTYNALGLIETIDGPRTDIPDITTFEYDTNGQQTKVINALGQTTEFTQFDSAGRVTQIIHPTGVIESFIYNSRGWLTSRTFNGKITSYTYDAIGQMTQINFPNGNINSFEYDSVHQLIATIDFAGNRTDYILDTMGNVTETKITDTLGNTQFIQNQQYDKFSNLIESINGSINDASEVKSTITYDLSGNITSQIDGLNNTTTNTLDSLERLTEQLNPINGQTTTDYNDKNLVEQITDPENKATQYQYNAFGELTQLNSPDTGITLFNYDKAGNLTSKTDAKSITVNLQYDSLNRLILKSFSDTSENVSYSYDSTANNNNGIGSLTSVTDSQGTHQIKYDAFGRITQETQTVSGVSYTSSYQFDDVNSTYSMTYPNGNIVTFQNNVQGQAEAISIDIGGVTTGMATNINYQPFGPMSGLTYGNGLMLDQGFDLGYKLTSQQVAGINDNSYSYDLTGNIDSIDTLLKNLNFQYDPLSRLINSIGDSPSSSLSYDGIGNRLTQQQVFTTYETIIIPDLIAFYDFDQGLMNDVTGIDNGSYVRDAIIAPGRTNDSITFPQVESLYWLNQDPSIATVELPVGYEGENGITISFWHKEDRINNYTRQIVGNEDLGFLCYYNWCYFYTNGWGTGYWPGKTYFDSTSYRGDWHHWTGRLEPDGTASIFIDGVLLYSAPGGLPPTSSTFSIGGNLANDNRGIEGQVDDLTVFSRALTDAEILTLKDGLNQEILTATHIETTNYVYDLQNQQLQTDGVKTYQYDANGNTISDGQRSYSYNQNNRMSQSSNGTLVTNYGYNYKGQRVSKSNSSETIHYIYDLQGLLIAEADATGNTLKQYVYLNGQPFAQVINGNVYYYHNSHLGLPQVVTDASQNIVWQASHTSFGKATVTEETIKNNIRFPGQYFDSETGLHYNYFRDYDPEIGRYIQSDPIGLAGGMNTYGYVGGNPVGFVDPFGQSRTRPRPRPGQTNFQGPALRPVRPGGGNGNYWSSNTRQPTYLQQPSNGQCPRFYYEILYMAPIYGNNRSSHRRSANRDFFETLNRDQQFREYFNQTLGGNVNRHMSSGRGQLRNPQNTEWHHPAHRNGFILLLRRTEHRNPDIQGLLHPSGRGGYYNFFNNNSCSSCGE